MKTLCSVEILKILMQYSLLLLVLVSGTWAIGTVINCIWLCIMSKFAVRAKSFDRYYWLKCHEQHLFTHLKLRITKNIQNIEKFNNNNFFSECPTTSQQFNVKWRRSSSQHNTGQWNIPKNHIWFSQCGHFIVQSVLILVKW